MATQNLIRHRFYNNDGSLAVGGKVYTYQPGTTTPVTTYTDSLASTPNTNPIILDSKGECGIWQTQKIKVNLLQSDNTQVTGFPVDYVGFQIVGDEIHASTNKVTPIDTDEVGIWNSISQLLNHVTFANLWAWIQSKLAAPGPIGGTTASTGSFTTLNSTGGALNGTLGAVTPATVTATAVNTSNITMTTGVINDCSQINFPATQNPSANVNTLDDYEEGTFTPVATGGTTAGVGTYPTQLGKYTKIGNIVFFNINLYWTAHTGTGNLYVSLPFTPLTPPTHAVSVFSAVSSNLTLTASNTLIAYQIGTDIAIKQAPVGGGAYSAVTMDTTVDTLDISGFIFV